MHFVVENEMIPSKISIPPTNLPTNILTKQNTSIITLLSRNEVLEISVVLTTRIGMILGFHLRANMLELISGKEILRIKRLHKQEKVEG